MARFEMTDLEWGFIKCVLPTKVRGVKRGDDRRVLNGIFMSCARVFRGGIYRSSMGLILLFIIDLTAGPRREYGAG
jgi:hypothetical protein